MPYLYNYFYINKLFSEFKFNRVMKIKKFISLINFKWESIDTIEHKIYSQFIFNWVYTYNSLWYKVPFIQNIFN